MTVGELVAALAHQCPCFKHPCEIFLLRADVAVWLLGGLEKIGRRQAESLRRGRDNGRPAGPGRRRVRADGSVEVSINSMDDLAKFLQTGIA